MHSSKIQASPSRPHFSVLFLSVGFFVCFFAFVPSLKLPSISILAHDRLPLDVSLMDEILRRVTSIYPRPPGIPAGFLCCPSSLGMVWKLAETGHYGCVKICLWMRPCKLGAWAVAQGLAASPTLNMGRTPLCLEN